jgi:hypothetical protein
MRNYKRENDWSSVVIAKTMVNGDSFEFTIARREVHDSLV